MNFVSDDEDWKIVMEAPGQALIRCAGKRIVAVGHPCPHCGQDDFSACQSPQAVIAGVIQAEQAKPASVPNT